MKTKPINVAIADDHQLFRAGVVKILNSKKDIDVVLDVDDGIYLLREMSQMEVLPDMCIVDISMPIMNGYDTCTALQNKYPKIPILALSMYKNDRAVVKMLSSGAKGFLHKDCSPQELHGAIISISNTGYYYPESLSLLILQVLQSLPKSKFEFSVEEQMFLMECCKEKTYKEISKEMSNSDRATEWLRDSLFKKLQVNTRVGLAISAIKMGIIHLD